MIITAGLDVGSTYTKAVIQREDGEILGKAFGPTGFRLREMARSIYDEALTNADLHEKDIVYVIATGAGRSARATTSVSVLPGRCRKAAYTLIL